MTHLRLSSWILIAALASFTSACTEPNEAYGKAYCDTSGCFQCEFNGQCDPIPNAKCKADGECKAGEKCTNRGCAKVCQGSESCGGGLACISELIR